MGDQQPATERTVTAQYRLGSSTRIGTDVGLSTVAVVLWTTVVVASVLDVLTTTIGLRRGFQEGNGVARVLVEAVGVPGFAGLKLAALIVLAVTWRRVDERQGYVALVGFGSVTVVVVALNVVTIATG